MTILFEPITLEKQKEYIKHFARCPQKASDYSFINLWGWAEEYGLYWAWKENLVWIKQTVPEVLYWAPVGPWQDINWAECMGRHITASNTFIRIPDKLVRYWKDHLNGHLRFRTEEARGHWDYLYTISDLVNLQGNQFHKKKNLLNQFKKKYNYRYQALGADLIDRALAMQTDWCAWRDCESSETLSAENRAIERVFKYWNQLAGVTGGALLINREMAAYTIAEPLSNDTLLIHFEKANSDFKGGYQAINQMFLAQSQIYFKTVNREQDLNDEGLRRAKLSYHPSGFLQKFRVTFSRLSPG